MAYEAYVFPSVFTDREVLEFTKMSDAIANPRIVAGDVIPGAIGISALAEGAVTNSKIADEAVTKDKIASDSIGNRTLMDRGVFAENIALWAVDNDRLATGAVDARVANFGTMDLNAGKLFPLANFDLDGSNQSYTQKVMDSIIDVSIHGAKQGKVYQLDSVRNGLSGSYGVRLSSFDTPVNGSLDSSTRKLVFNLIDNDIQLIDDYEDAPNIKTIITKAVDGVSVAVTYDSSATGSIVNMAENEQGYAFGTIVHPAKYTYANVSTSGSVVTDDKTYVEKTLTDMHIYVPTVDGYYTGFHMYRHTQAFEEGVRWSNADIWAINRISLYTRNGSDFTEDPNNVFVYSSTNKNTMDTIFRLTGEKDYSGGYYHGDEILESFKIFVGDTDVTDLSGQFSGSSVEFLQHTNVHEDTYTAGKLTDAYLKVKKVHRFNKDDVYTLKSRLEFLKDVSVEFSNPGALSMARTDPNGNVNFKTAIDLSNMETHDISTTGALSTGDNIDQWKFIGNNRDVTVTYETDSDYLNTWVRNSESDSKLYSRLIPQDGAVTTGTVINASVNYKFNSYK